MIVDYETSVRYAHLYTAEINNVLKRADGEMKKALGKDFMGLMILPSKDPAAKPVFIPAFQRKAPSANASLISRQGIYRIYIQLTETGKVFEFVADQ